MSKAKQNTLDRFYKKVNPENSENICCPGCNENFSFEKFKWHRDFHCKKHPKSYKRIKLSSKKDTKTSKKYPTRSRTSLRNCKTLSTALDHPDIITIVSESENEDEIISCDNSLGHNDNEKQRLSSVHNVCDDASVKSEGMSSTKNDIIHDLLKDWETPQKSPPKNDTPSFKDNSGFELLSVQSSVSENEFEENELSFRSPELKRRKKIKKSKTSSSKLEQKTLPELPISKSLSNNLEASVGDFSDNNSSMSSFRQTPPNRSMLVTPTRTPGSSSDASSTSEKVSLQKSKVSLLKCIKSAEKIEVTNSLKEDITFTKVSPFLATASSHKKTPTTFLRSLQKTSLQNSCVSPSIIKVRRNLYSSQPEFSTPASPSQKQKISPDRFRSEKGMYLENFLHIIDIVTSQPDDLRLFNEDDLKVLRDFHQLSLQARKLYVRIFQRKLKWNRVCKIEYKEICDKEDIPLYINELVYAGFLLSEVTISSLEDLFHLLDLNEIKQLCKEMKIPTAGNKSELVKKLMKCNQQQKFFLTSFNKESDKETLIMKLTVEKVGKAFILNKAHWNMFMRVLLLYSPRHFDEDEEAGQQAQLFTLLMVSIGKMKFPPCQINRQHTLYQSREEVLRVQHCMQMENEIQECCKNQDWETAIKLCTKADEMYKELLNDEIVMKHEYSLPPFLRRFTALSLLCHTQSLAVDAHQRLKQYNKAVNRLEQLLAQKTHLQDYRGRWYDRLALNLHQHLKKPKRCLEVIKEALDDPEVREGHRLALSLRAERLLISKATRNLAQQFEDELKLSSYEEVPKVFIQGKSFPSDIPGYKRVYLNSGDGDENKMCSVEQLVLSHYRKEGYINGLHCESRTVRGLFGLFMWNILFLPLPDVFRSPHQGVPLDLDSPHFYSARKKEIDKRLKQMEEWTLEEANMELQEVWNENFNFVSIVDWKLFETLEFVQGLVAGLGLKLISAVCRRLAQDHRFTRSGFPDLIVWSPEEMKSRIVEVKGPNDKLSPKQMLWLDYLVKHGGVAEVCHVEAVGLKRTGILKNWRESPRKRDRPLTQLHTETERRGKRKRN